MAERGITEEEMEHREETLLERDTRNIILGGVISMLSSITALFVYNSYLKSTAAAAIAEYTKRTSQIQKTDSLLIDTNSLSNSTYIWKPLSHEEINNIHMRIEYGN